MTEQELCQRAYDLARDNADQLHFLAKWLIGLATLVILQLIIKVVEHVRVGRIYDRVESLLTMAEMHGGLTDQKAKEIKTAVVASTKGLAAVVKSTAEEVKKEVKAAQSTSTQSSDGSIVVVVPEAPPPAGA